MRYLIISVAAFAALATAQPAQSQSPWSLELTGAAAFPTQALDGTDLETGLGFGANVRYRFLPHLAAYAGWDWHHFRTEELIGGQEIDVEDTGYAFGLRFEHPLTARADAVAGWIRAGGLVNHIELEDEDGELIGDSDHGLGWEVGGGLTVPISPRIALTPGVRYRSLSRDLEIGNVTSSVTLSYVTVGAGLVITF